MNALTTSALQLVNAQVEEIYEDWDLDSWLPSKGDSDDIKSAIHEAFVKGVKLALSNKDIAVEIDANLNI